MKFLKLAVLALVFTSCAQVLFNAPQPQKGMVIKSFIDDVQGVYSDSALQVEIGKKQLKIGGETYDLVSKDPSDNQVLVKFYNEFYFASFRDSVYYSVYMARFYDNKLALYMMGADGLSISRIRRLIPVDEIDSINKTYLVSPSKKQFDDLLDYEMFEVIDVLEKQ